MMSTELVAISTMASGATMGGSEQEAVELTLLALGLVVIAALAATLCIVTTIVALRPSGMGLTRVPLFSWSMLVSGGMWLLTLPVLVANIAIIWVDLRGVTALAYGQPANIYAQLSWVFDQPQIFAFALPVLGIVGDIIPVAFGQRQRLYGVLQFAIGALGFLSFGAFANRYFNPNVTDEVLFVVMGLLVILAGLSKAPWVFGLAMGSVVLGSLGLVVYSYLLWRRERPTT